MQLRRMIGCLVMCIVFVLSSTYAQAARQVGDHQGVCRGPVDLPKLAPHYDHDHHFANEHKVGGYRDIRCSGLPCRVGFVTEYNNRRFNHRPRLQGMVIVSAVHSTLDEPLSPPSKTASIGFTRSRGS